MADDRSVQASRRADELLKEGRENVWIVGRWYVVVKVETLVDGCDDRDFEDIYRTTERTVLSD